MPANCSLEYICSARACNLGFVLARLVEGELVHMLLVVEGRHIHLAVEDSHPESVVVDILLPVDQGRLGIVAVQDMTLRDAAVLGVERLAVPADLVEERHSYQEEELRDLWKPIWKQDPFFGY
jgi:hypothetical protein